MKNMSQDFYCFEKKVEIVFKKIIEAVEKSDK